MKREQRKAAVTAYRERKVTAGIYAVFCTGLGQRWAGRAADLDTIGNRLWFSLRQGNCLHRTLQAAWNAHGPSAFTLEIVERLDEETLSYVRDHALTDRLAYWCSEPDPSPEIAGDRRKAARSQRRLSTARSLVALLPSVTPLQGTRPPLIVAEKGSSRRAFDLVRW